MQDRCVVPEIQILQNVMTVIDCGFQTPKTPRIKKCFWSTQAMDHGLFGFDLSPRLCGSIHAGFCFVPQQRILSYNLGLILQDIYSGCVHHSSCFSRHDDSPSTPVFLFHVACEDFGLASGAPRPILYFLHHFCDSCFLFQQH
jgi:hypothetical protein